MGSLVRAQEGELDYQRVATINRNPFFVSRTFHEQFKDTP